MERWPLAVEAHPAEEVKDKLSELILLLSPPHPPTAHTQPYLGFVHPRALKQTANFIS